MDAILEIKLIVHVSVAHDFKTAGLIATHSQHQIPLRKMADEEKEKSEAESKGVIPLFASFQEYLSSDQEIREVRLIK